VVERTERERERERPGKAVSAFPGLTRLPPAFVKESRGSFPIAPAAIRNFPRSVAETD